MILDFDYMKYTEIRNQKSKMECTETSNQKWFDKSVIQQRLTPSFLTTSLTAPSP